AYPDGCQVWIVNIYGGSAGILYSDSLATSARHINVMLCRYVEILRYCRRGGPHNGACQRFSVQRNPQGNFPDGSSCGRDCDISGKGNQISTRLYKGKLCAPGPMPLCASSLCGLYVINNALADCYG